MFMFVRSQFVVQLGESNFNWDPALDAGPSKDTAHMVSSTQAFYNYLAHAVLPFTMGIIYALFTIQCNTMSSDGRIGASRLRKYARLR